MDPTDFRVHVAAREGRGLAIASTGLGGPGKTEAPKGGSPSPLRRCRHLIWFPRPPRDGTPYLSACFSSPRRKNSYTTLSPCCCVKNPRVFSSRESSVPNSSLLLTLPLDTNTPVGSLSS